MTSTAPIVLVQLSDLHFGAEPVTKRWDPIAGYRAHDFELAQALPVALEDVVVDLRLPDAHPLHVIVSGDVTVSGTAEEFAVASEYLTGRRRLDPRDLRPWGIASWASEHHKVPGNHDHWNGRLMRPFGSLALQQAFNPGLFPRFFRRHAWGPVAIDAGSLRVEVCGADTQSGFRADQTNLRARGRLSPGHLRVLAAGYRKAPAPASAATVRVLVLHHPIDAGRVPYMDLDVLSCRLVERHAAAHGVGVVLAGHRHQLDLLPPRPGPPGKGRAFWELRAPSAFQGTARDGVHGFLVHRVERRPRRPTSIQWTCFPYLWRADTKGFRCVPDDQVRFELPALRR